MTAPKDLLEKDHECHAQMINPDHNMASVPIQSKNITLLFEYPTLNGGERSMLAVIDALQSNNVQNYTFQFQAIAPAIGLLAEALSERSIPVISCQLINNKTNKRFPPNSASLRLLDSIQQRKTDLVHANSLSMGRLLGRIAPQLSIPAVSHVRDIMKLSKAAISDLNQNSQLIAVSHATKDFHIQQGVKPNRLQVIYNGVDCEQFHPRPATNMLHQELGLPQDAFLVATIGQVGLRKGQNILAEAAIRLRETMPHAHYLMIGERHSSKQESIDFKQNIVNQFDHSEMTHQLHWLGFRHDVSRILNEIDLLVHPAHQEPLGRVLLEASAAGCPIIATDVGGTSEILEHQHSALLVPPNNTKSLSIAMQTLYDDLQQRQSLANNSRTNIEQNFSIDHAAKNLMTFWRQQL